jgi:hypoxanthine-DNA glycosylase
VIESFPPVATAESRVLILGSMPGAASLRAGQYYAHPRNAFWPIMDVLCGAGPALPYPQRLARLQSAGIALWDALRACERSGSLDSAIRDEVANDFSAFFAAHPRITRVFFNGAKAEAAFRRHVVPVLPMPPAALRLPSTSPAYAGLEFDAKCRAWRAITACLAEPVAGAGG